MAQTKISGTAQCGKPETVGKADSDRAGHTMELGKGPACQLPRFDDHQKRPAGGALQRHAVLYGRDRRAKGLAGQGNIYTVTVNADRTSTVAVEGDYTIAEPTPKEAKQKPPSQ